MGEECGYMGHKRNIQRFEWKFQRKETHRTSECRWYGNIKMALK